MLEKILNLGKNFNKTTLPGSVFFQNFCGKFEEKFLSLIFEPKVEGLVDKDPEVCLHIMTHFFFLRKIATTTDRHLSQIVGLVTGVILTLSRRPLENTVMCPELFLPEAFFKKVLNRFDNFEDLTKKLLFLKRWEGDVGLCNLIKIYCYIGI